jgi:hypothetical protein
MPLATIEASRVAEEARPMLEAFQLRCQDVLAQYFFKLHHEPVKAAPAVVAAYSHSASVGSRAPAQRA